MKKLVVMDIHFPNTSVNRNKYSEPGDVLIVACSKSNDSLRNFGISQFTVGSIPKSINSAEDINNSDVDWSQWSWDVIHVPEPNNYAHSEIRTFYEKQYPPKRKPNKTIKKWWRTVLREHVTVIQEPQI